MRSMPSAVAHAAGPVLLDKMDEVTRYIHSQASHTHTLQHTDHVPVDTSSLSLNAQDDGADRIVTVMHPSSYSSQICRQVSLSTESQISEVVSSWDQELLTGGIPGELTEDGGFTAAIMAVHFGQPGKQTLLHDIGNIPKVTHVRQEIESTVLMDGPMRAIFNGQNLSEQADPIVVSVPSLPPLPPLPPLQNLKSCPDSWYHDKTDKDTLKNDQQILSEAEQLQLAESPPARGRPNRKSLPHKKRLSRRLRRAGGGTPQPDAAALGCEGRAGEGQGRHEEILPDNFVNGHEHHATHEVSMVRPILICQICGDFYGEEQYKFYHHLKEHYDPHGATIIIENPVTHVTNVNHLTIDKMNTCIVDNAAQLPESLVELSLENTGPSKMSVYHNAEKHVLYTSGDKSLSYMGNKCTYSTAIMEIKDAHYQSVEKEIYETLEKSPVYSCTRCNKSFRKQKLCEAHIREAHSKLDEMSEFSEPEDLMEGINVIVDGEAEGAAEGNPDVAPDEPGELSDGNGNTFMPHLTVENGHVHQEHIKHWFMRNVVMNGEIPLPEAEGCPEPAAGQEAPTGYMCPVCSHTLPTREACTQHMNHCSIHLKEEVLIQRIFESEVDSAENQPLTPNMVLADAELRVNSPQESRKPSEKPLHVQQDVTDESAIIKKIKTFICQECKKVFHHRNSLLYHLMSHKGSRPHKCADCQKGFYTAGALKVHSRIHADSKPYKCKECGRDFRQWGDLKYHMVSLHTDQKHYKCEFCKKEFARKYSLNIHRKIHTGERNYKCEFCSKTFRASSYRLAHMRTHTDERPFNCKECKKAFKVAGDLRRHQQIHEKIRERPKKELKVNIKFLDEPAKRKSSRIKIMLKKDESILPDEKNKSPDKDPGEKPKVGLEPAKEERDGDTIKGLIDKLKGSIFPSGHLKVKLDLKHNDEKAFVYYNYPERTNGVESQSSKSVSKNAESPPKNITPFEHLKKKEVRSSFAKQDGVLQSDSIESGFLERLTALYNIEPV